MVEASRPSKIAKVIRDKDSQGPLFNAGKKILDLAAELDKEAKTPAEFGAIKEMAVTAKKLFEECMQLEVSTNNLFNAVSTASSIASCASVSCDYETEARFLNLALGYAKLGAEEVRRGEVSLGTYTTGVTQLIDRFQATISRVVTELKEEADLEKRKALYPGVKAAMGRVAALQFAMHLVYMDAEEYEEALKALVASRSNFALSDSMTNFGQGLDSIVARCLKELNGVANIVEEAGNADFARALRENTLERVRSELEGHYAKNPEFAGLVHVSPVRIRRGKDGQYQGSPIEMGPEMYR